MQKIETRETTKAVIINDWNDVLVLYRSENDTHRPGEYDFPGGGLHPGERPGFGMRRELIEETGSYFAGIYLFPVASRKDPGRSGDYLHQRHVYVARVIGCLPVALSSEHTGYDWLPQQEVAEGLSHPVHRELFHIALEVAPTLPQTPPVQLSELPELVQVG